MTGGDNTSQRPDPAASPGTARWAQAGDWITVGSDPRRTGMIVAVTGDPLGQPPYLVRWHGSGRLSLLHPGADAVVDHRDFADLDPGASGPPWHGTTPASARRLRRARRRALRLALRQKRSRATRTGSRHGGQGER